MNKYLIIKEIELLDHFSHNSDKIDGLFIFFPNEIKRARSNKITDILDLYWGGKLEGSNLILVSKDMKLVETYQKKVEEQLASMRTT